MSAAARSREPRLRRLTALTASANTLPELAWLTAALDEASERAARAAGPGGQHVNKTSTAVELRFDIPASLAVPESVKPRLCRLAGARLTLEGVVVIFAQEHRSQQRNREAARERLADLLRRAAAVPKRRRPTRPTLASRLQRLETKVRRGGIKAGRGRPAHDD